MTEKSHSLLNSMTENCIQYIYLVEKLHRIWPFPYVDCYLGRFHPSLHPLADVPISGPQRLARQLWKAEDVLCKSLWTEFKSLWPTLHQLAPKTTATAQPPAMCRLRPVRPIPTTPRRFWHTTRKLWSSFHLHQFVCDKRLSRYFQRP